MADRGNVALPGPSGAKVANHLRGRRSTSNHVERIWIWERNGPHGHHNTRHLGSGLHCFVRPTEPPDGWYIVYLVRWCRWQSYILTFIIFFYLGAGYCRFESLFVILHAHRFAFMKWKEKKFLLCKNSDITASSRIAVFVISSRAATSSNIVSKSNNLKPVTGREQKSVNSIPKPPFESWNPFFVNSI
jgi:hypothetical protein